jgi:hypothetical protein
MAFLKYNEKNLELALDESNLTMEEKSLYASLSERVTVHS